MGWFSWLFRSPVCPDTFERAQVARGVDQEFLGWRDKLVAVLISEQAEDPWAVGTAAIPLLRWLRGNTVNRLRLRALLRAALEDPYGLREEEEALV